MQCTNTTLGPTSIHGKVEAELHILVRQVGKHLCSRIFNTSKTLLCPKIQLVNSPKFYKVRFKTCIFFKRKTK